MMKFGIVCSRYHSRYTDALLASARAALKGHRIVAVRVPGAFEIPFALKRLAQKKPSFDALIALGLIWQGETDHADLIAQETARACMEIMLKYDLPVVFEVLTIRTEAQAKVRCLGKRLNRGQEAAQTALEMAKVKI